MRQLRIVAVVTLALLAVSCAVIRRGPKQIPPSYEDSPVYFEMFWKESGDSANLALMPEGYVRLEPLGVESIKGFDWKSHKRKDPSWWIRMERMDYLLPLIESDDEIHQEFAREWIEGWLDAHEINRTPNVGSRDAMGIGIRGMVLVRYLKEIESKDKEMAERLKKSIQWTQDYLLDERHFNMVSNHAMWESMGLFETTRVFPDTMVTRVALERLVATVKASASDLGMHMEHSPGYHFHFLGWLSNYVDYLESLDMPGYADIPALAEIDRRMKLASYYLYDHLLKLPQIGDTDGKRFSKPPYPVASSDRQRVWYDEQAGYAIFKDDPSSNVKRYVVFCNQSKSPRMRFHYHNDRLAVYYAYGGEIILGDAGRYSYTRSAIRSYVQSACAHNTIIRADQITRQGHRVELVRNAWWQQRDGAELFSARLNDSVIRTVTIPADEPKLFVHDQVATPDPYVILWHAGADVQTFDLTDSTVTDSLRTYQWTLITRRDRWFRLSIDVKGVNAEPGGEMTMVEGQQDPRLGWYSPGYNTLIPVPTVQLRIVAKGRVRVATRVVLTKP